VTISTIVTHRDLGGVADERRHVAAREVGIVVFAASVYFGVRLLVEGSTHEAIRNAERVLRFERWLGIDIERSAQSFVLDNPLWRALGNISYVWFHWPLVIAVLIVLFGRDREVYLRLRRALCASGFVGLVLFWLLPTAPPRFMPGFEGTVSDAARTHYLHYPLSWANRYAAFPSFHVGWTLIACLALAATMAGRGSRLAAMVPAVLVALAVVTTGNHYVTDAVAGTVIALVAYWWFGRSAPDRAEADLRNGSDPCTSTPRPRARSVGQPAAPPVKRQDRRCIDGAQTMPGANSASARRASDPTPSTLPGRTASAND
jgi:membrane-associated phospholipid phosphatase